MLKAKAFNANKEFDEDLFHDMLTVIQSKIQTINSDRELINLSYSIMRNITVTKFKNESKFSSRKFIQDDDAGMTELTPDHLGSSQNEQEEFIEGDELEFDLNVLKVKLKKIQDRMNTNNTSKNTDIFSFLMDYTNDHTKSLQDLCDEYQLGNDRNLRNLLLTIKSGLKMKNNFRKATKPYDELKPSGRSLRKKRFRENAKD